MRIPALNFIGQIISMFVLVSVVLIALSSPAATCTGSDPCHACKNCRYCKHCAKEGGTCGVCKSRAKTYGAFEIL
jgi:hypothetical protein